MDLHVNSKFRFLSTPPPTSIHPPPLPQLKTKQKKVCLANLSDILVGSKNNLLHGLGRNLESFLESDAHHSSLVNKKKKTLYLLYFIKSTPHNSEQAKQAGQFFSQHNALWLLVNASEHKRDTSTPYTKIGPKQQKRTETKWRASREESLFSLPTDDQTKRDF